MRRRMGIISLLDLAGKVDSKHQGSDDTVVVIRIHTITSKHVKQAASMIKGRFNEAYAERGRALETPVAITVGENTRFLAFQFQSSFISIAL